MVRAYLGILKGYDVGLHPGGMLTPKEHNRIMSR